VADEKLQLYLAHRAALLDYAAPIVGCRARAEDVVQEAWLRFSRQQDDADIRHPASYLYRIVRNLALDQTRRTATEKAQPRRRAVDRCAGQGRAGRLYWATGQAGRVGTRAFRRGAAAVEPGASVAVPAGYLVPG